MDCRADAALSLLTLKRTHTWLGHIATGDEKWIFYSNIYRRAQWVDKGTDAEDVPKPNVHAKKVMLCIWWNVHGVEYRELIPQGFTVTADVYIEQLKNLKTNHENAPRSLLPARQRSAAHCKNDQSRPNEIRLDHFSTPIVFPRPGSLRLAPSFLSPTSSGWSRLPNPRRHQKGIRVVLQGAVPSVLEQGHLRSA